MEKWQWCCVSNKTCLTSHFGMTEANPQKSKLPLRFFHFFRPPNFSEKGKGKFCFLRSAERSGADGAESYHIIGA